MPNLTQMAREYIQDKEEKGLIEKGWKVVHESVLICPCGHRIEWDGNCPNGCESPLKTFGII